MDYKELIINNLEILRQSDLSQGEKFKAIAYAKVIKQLKELGKPVYSFDDLKDVKGIGEKIERKIKEIMETGELRSAVRAQKEVNVPALQLFQDIYGIGITKAKELTTKHKISTIDELNSLLLKNPDILNDKQKIGLKYYEDLKLRIPRDEMILHEKLLKEIIPNDFEFEIVGSYRRKATSSGDIDLLIRVKKEQEKKAGKMLKNVIQTLQDKKYIIAVLALGDKKCLAISQLEGKPARRIDFLMTPDKEYPYSLLYFTGNAEFNVVMRKIALEKGYSMSEHSMIKMNPSVPDIPVMKTEEDIFKFLGIKYVKPEERVPQSIVLV
jgi:DNA polymerase lambda